MKRRNIGIDLIKFLACLFVVALHTFGPGGKNTGVLPNFMYYFSTPAIGLFFMANGFFVLNSKKVGSLSYAFSKIKKIFFTMMAWILLLGIAEGVLHYPNFLNAFTNVFLSTFQYKVKFGGGIPLSILVFLVSYDHNSDCSFSFKTS